MAIRTRTLLSRAFLFAALVGPFAASEALLLQLTVTGEVSAVSASLSGAFSPGDAMSATFVYDSDTPPAGFPLTSATYPGALVGGSFTIGAYSGTSSGGPINVTDDDASFGDRLRFLNMGIVAAGIGTHDPFRFEVSLRDSSGQALTGIDLPESLPDLGAFDDSSWMLAFTPIALMGFEQTGVLGTLLSATVTPIVVPEPAGILLIGLGLAIGLLARRTARRI